MALATTTLSVAVALTDTSIVVASATSVAAGRLVLVDQEMMKVMQSYVSGTTVPVQRGIDGSATVAHKITANVTHGAATDFDEVVRIGRGLDLQNSVDGTHQRNQVVDRTIARLWRELRVLACPFQLVEDRVLRFLFPVEQEHVLEERRKFAVRLDAGPVVRLRIQLNETGQRQHRPRRFAQHDRCDVVGPRQERIARRHPGADEGLDPAKQFLVLEFFVRKSNQRLERGLVAEPIVVGQLEHLGADVSLDQTEDVGVRAALYLRQQAAFVGTEKRNAVNKRQAVRQEFLGEVDFAMASSNALLEKK